MKAIYTYIAVIVVALVAVYFSLEQKRKFNEALSMRDKLVTDNRNVSANASAKEQELKTGKEELAATQARRDELAASVDSLKSTAEVYNRDIVKADAFLAQFAQQEDELAEARKRLEEMSKNLGRGLDPDDLDDSLAQLKGQKEQRVSKLDQIDVEIDTAKKAIESNQEELKRLVQREEERQAELARYSMEAVVTGVNQDWGFLVIGAGSNSGFTPQSGLIVQRDGRMIARVRPSSIEPTQTIAEINFDSVAPGVLIQPGDRVIFESPSAN